MQKRWTNVLLFVVAGIIGLYLYNKYRVAPEIKLDQLELLDENGQLFDVNTLKGRNLVVSFYASWCGNCLDELREINKIKNQELSDVEIVCITDEPIDKLISFKESKGYPFTFLKLNKHFPEIGIHSIPVTYIINKNLEIVKEQIGYIPWDDPSTLNHIKGLYK